jgi:GNAT superfamily N-acetyltransferase
MDRITFENSIYKNWTDHFERPVETAQQNGTTLLPESKYEGDKVIAIWHIGNHSFVQFDPAYSAPLNTLVNNLPANTSLTGDLIQSAWGSEPILSRDIGLTYYLYPSDLAQYSPTPPFLLRRLSEADVEAMSALHSANTPEDVDEGFVEVTHRVAFGCFLGEQLAAAASGYERTGFLDIGVLAHPEFRKKGLGKAVVGAICDWANQNNIIAQYRHNILNTSSQHVAKSLNFQMYFQSEGIFLKQENLPTV